MKNYQLPLLFTICFFSVIVGKSQPSYFFPNPVYASTGDQICVPMTVRDFTDMIAVDAAFSWDSEVLEFQNLQNLHPGVNGLDLSDFEITNAPNGIIQMSWESGPCDPNNQNQPLATTLTDDEILFELCFEVIGLENQTSPLNFVDGTLPLYATRLSASCFDIGEFTNSGAVIVCNSLPCCGNEIKLFGNTVIGELGDTVRVDFRFTNFIDVTSFQFSINWDSDKVEFVDVTFPSISVGNFNIDDNSLSLQWGNSLPTTLPDSSIVVSLDFEIIEGAGGILVAVTDNPTLIEFSVNEAITGCYIVENGLINTACNLIQSIIPDTTLCTTSDIQLMVNAPDAVSFAWSPADNLSDPNIANPIASPSFTENYTVIVTDANGCTEAASVFVNIPFGLDWGLQPWSNSPVCEGEGDSLSLFSTMPFGIESWLWTGPNGFTSTEANPIIPDPTTINSGLYNVTLTDNNGCEGTAEFFVTVEDCTPCNIIQSVSPFPDTVLCNIDYVQLMVDAPSAVTFEWYPADNLDDPTIANPIAFPIFNESYHVIVTDADGCTEEASIFIEVPFGLDWSLQPWSNSPLCEGDSFLRLYSIMPFGIESWLWTGPNGFTSTEANPEIADPTQINAGLYNVTLTDDSGCEGTAEFFVDIEDCVWPGDTDTSATVNAFDLLNIGLRYDSTGSMRPNSTLDWTQQFATDWLNPNALLVDDKHIDTDGNGIINADDTLAIVQNWGATHQLWVADDREMGTPFFVQSDTITEMTTYGLPIILGDTNIPAEDVYGIAFTIEIDTSVLASSASIKFNDSWLGNIDSDMIAIQKTSLAPQGGQVEVGITRIDGQNMTGLGQVGTFYITIEDIIFQSPSGGTSTAVEKALIFPIINVRAITFEQEDIAIDTNVQPSLATSSQQTFLEQHISIFPNPSIDVLHLHSKGLLIEQLNLYQVTGQHILSEKVNHSIHQLKLSHLTTGVYWLQIHTDKGVLNQRVIKK